MGAHTVWVIVFVVASLIAALLIGRGHFGLSRSLRRGWQLMPLDLLMVGVGWAMLVALVVTGFVIEIHRNTGYTK